jgi:transcriptional regulator with XRE-family HTH domain
MPELSLGQQLATWREKRGLSLQKAGAAAELDPTAILRIERDEREPKISSVAGLARAYGLRIVCDPDGIYIEDAGR